MKGRIVVVEDDDLIAHLIGLILKRRDYAVTGWATTGEESLARVVETSPDLVLMDIRLNGRMDGIDAATYVRTILHVPVVFVTASGDDATLARAQGAHPYGYISKPFNEREMFAAIEFAIHQHASADRNGYRRQPEEWEIPAVAITDPEGRIFYLNRSGENLLGIAPGKGLSRLFDDLVRLRDPATATMVHELLGSTINGALSRRELCLLRADGRERYVGVETCTLQNAEGERQGALAILRPL
ncbi:MAG: response regulator [Methanomicrobiales archaeon]|nr:response regulator [Methanomicrobiales archaeon]